MLNTLILPGDKDALAGKLLQDAINDLDVILMLVIGGEERQQIVQWADQLCNKTKKADGSNSRHVVWVMNPQLPSVKAILEPILGSASPVVAVLNFYDKLKASINDATDIDPLDLEQAFLTGGE